MTYTAHLRALLALGLPLVGSNLAQASLHVTDTVMLGWYGVEALAAVVLGASTFFILFIIGSGFAIAVMPLVASAQARGDGIEARRATRMGIWLSVIFGAAIGPALWWSRPILEALGQDPRVAELAQDYLRIAGAGLVPALLIMVLKSYLSALHRAGIVLWATLGGTVLNAGLNWALIFGNWGAPEMGVQGAAVATLATQMLTLGVLALYAGLHPALRKGALFGRLWRPDWSMFGRVFRLGWPIGLTGLAEGGLFVASALMMGWIGTIELAAHGIALEVASITFGVHLALSTAATVRAGRAMGAGDAVALADGARVAVGVSLIFALSMVALFLLAPVGIVSLFLDHSDPHAAEILAFGTTLLAVAALFQLTDALQVMALGFLRGVQDTRAPMWIAALSYWAVGVPASYALGFTFGLGGVGLWLGLVIGLTLAAALLMARFWRGNWVRS